MLSECFLTTPSRTHTSNPDKTSRSLKLTGIFVILSLDIDTSCCATIMFHLLIIISFCCICRYNLHRPDSDVDVFTVYQARTKDVLGLNPPKQTIKVSI